MDVEHLKAEIASKSSEEIYNELFISGEVWIFKSTFGDRWFEQYDKFKKYVAKKLDVHYNNIGIAGSAKLGFSLNPTKNFRNFNDTSDVDIIIVSQRLFNEFWEQYLYDIYKPTFIDKKDIMLTNGGTKPFVGINLVKNRIALP